MNSKNIFPEELENLLNKLPLIEESIVYGKRLSNNSKDVIVAARITVDKEFLKEKYGEDDMPSDSKLYQMVFDEIKKVNRMMVSYKAIKYLEIKKDEFEKTTTMKIKRYVELENTNPDNLITLESVEKVKKGKKKIRKKPINVEAKKLNDSEEIKEADKKI